MPSGESKKLSTVLKPGELPEGYQADFVITTLRVIIGSKVRLARLSSLPLFPVPCCTFACIVLKLPTQNE